MKTGLHLSGKLVGCVMLALAAGSLAGCSMLASASSDTPTPAPEAVMDVAPSNVVAEAVIEPAHYADLELEMSGTVAEVTVEEGSVVAAGDALVRLESLDLERAVAHAELDLRQAELKLEQLQEPPEEFEIARAEHRMARRRRICAPRDSRSAPSATAHC